MKTHHDLQDISEGQNQLLILSHLCFLGNKGQYMHKSGNWKYFPLGSTEIQEFPQVFRHQVKIRNGDYMPKIGSRADSSASAEIL